ncbi:MAG: 3'(2'),5'-bisphosphate nucleotidase [Rhodospirillaceae bacterium]|nr:3'(2'),5'-bisphosphate nucleotidase [Rhodospirillaceae bacterium]HAA92653.1 3'(2'),5'-bisphosphate nucleotidase [Rhodospirillaceae bacterium]
MTDLHRLLPDLVTLADRAGDAVMEIYATDFEYKTKDDFSPVTEADLAAEAIILEELARLTPDIPAVAEEQMAAGNVPKLDGTHYWLVDPLDGTKEFLNRNDEFTVNIGLIEDDRPVLGVVYAPALETSYWGAVEVGAHRRTGNDVAPITVRTPPEEGITVVGSRRHGKGGEMDTFLEPYEVNDTLAAGSSLKFCLVAEGKADIYPRFGPTCEWDTAAGHAVLEAAGGKVTNPDGSPFRYRKSDFLNSNFIAWGGLNAA